MSSSTCRSSSPILEDRELHVEDRRFLADRRCFSTRVADLAQPLLRALERVVEALDLARESLRRG